MMICKVKGITCSELSLDPALPVSSAEHFSIFQPIVLVLWQCAASSMFWVSFIAPIVSVSSNSRQLLSAKKKALINPVSAICPVLNDRQFVTVEHLAAKVVDIFLGIWWKGEWKVDLHSSSWKNTTMNLLMWSVLCLHLALLPPSGRKKNYCCFKDNKALIYLLPCAQSLRPKNSKV